MTYEYTHDLRYFIREAQKHYHKNGNFFKESEFRYKIF